MRCCATKGCTLRDFHDGAHSFEKCLLVREGRVQFGKEVHTDTKLGNDFMYDIGFVRKAVKENIDVRITLSGSAHPLATVNHHVELVVVDAGSTEKDVLVGEDAEGRRMTLNAYDLVGHDVHAHWNSPGRMTLSAHDASFIGKKHDVAARRMDFNVKVLRDNLQTSSKDMVASVDGHGANRDAFARGFADMPCNRTPDFHTFEIDPVAALAQQTRYGKAAVTYTGADWPFGYGCDGARPTTPSGIEYLLTTREDTAGRPNRLVSGEYCKDIVFLNLDYCGGIFGGRDFEEGKRVLTNMLARLPRLVVLCLTFGKRGRPGLSHDFELYAQTPYGFRVAHTFDSPSDNQRVVSRTYVRSFSVPRTIRVPGSMWHCNKSKSVTVSIRFRSWTCVVKSFEHQNGTFVLYSLEDDVDNQAFPSLDEAQLKEWEVKEPFHIPTEHEGQGQAILSDIFRLKMLLQMKWNEYARTAAPVAADASSSTVDAARKRKRDQTITEQHAVVRKQFFLLEEARVLKKGGTTKR